MTDPQCLLYIMGTIRVIFKQPTFYGLALVNANLSAAMFSTFLDSQEHAIQNVKHLEV